MMLGCSGHRRRMPAYHDGRDKQRHYCDNRNANKFWLHTDFLVVTYMRLTFSWFVTDLFDSGRSHKCINQPFYGRNPRPSIMVASSRACSRSLKPNGSSKTFSSAVKIKIFRVASKIAEQISQCSKCF